jgi:preprotein translocase subunit SecB
MSTTNGGPAPAANQQPQLNVVAQYIKDFSFENPNAPQSLAGGTISPQIAIQINVEARPLSETDIEVTLKLDGKAENEAKLMFRFELEFAGIFRAFCSRSRARSSPPPCAMAVSRRCCSIRWISSASIARS